MSVYYDPEQRAREKQRSRDADRAALVGGEKSQADLRRENSVIQAGRSKIDWSRLPSVRGLQVVEKA